jgi:metallo-beta-lactamase family protein
MTLSRGNSETAFSRHAYSKAIQSFHYCDYNQTVRFRDVAVRLYDAGHILGSSHVEIESGDTRVLFSGDIGVCNTPIICDPCCTWSGWYDAVVIESTYGDRTHRDRDTTVGEFGEILRQAVDMRGVLLIPAFAIGRTQEILFHCNTLIESGALPPMPVFVDSPMARSVTELYRRYTVCFDEQTCAQIERGDRPLDFPGLHAVESCRESCALKNTTPPFIIVAGSGMCTGGRICTHLKTFIGMPETTVMIVGWQARGTTGRELVDGARYIDIDGERYRVRARTVTLGGFSAHADREALRDWASQVPAHRFFVNHGEQRPAESLARLLVADGAKSAVAVHEGYEITV